MNLYNVNTIVTALILIFHCDAKILRNSALMNKMMTNFQKDNKLSTPKASNNKNSEIVASLMQNILCRNFPSIPCDMITNDKVLSKLIERSIQQINNKKMTIDRTTKSIGLTLFPIINSEDLSTFLQVHDPGNLNTQKKKHKKVRTVKEMDRKPQKYTKKIQRKETKRTAVYNGRKKLRKFYPHKMKYKDKSREMKHFGDYSEEKLSMSVEVPDLPLAERHQHLSYKMEPENSVWRIDYTKHGEPSLNVVTYDERLRGKTAPNVIVDEQVEKGARNDILHPDVFIKNHFVKKKLMGLHSEDIE